MSYDIRLVDKDGNVLHSSKPHTNAGGTYAIGGTTELWLNITWNYGGFFRDVFGDKGIRELYGKTGERAAEMIEGVIPLLGGPASDDYWEACPGNARAALLNLLDLCKMAPAGIVDGD